MAKRKRAVIKNRHGLWYLVRYESPEKKSFIARVIRHKVFGAVSPSFNLKRRLDDANKYPNRKSAFYEALRQYELPRWKVMVLDTARSKKRAMEKKTALISEYRSLASQGGYNLQDGEHILADPAARKRFIAVASQDKLSPSKHEQVVRLAKSRVGTRAIAEVAGISRPATRRILRKHRIKPNGKHPEPRGFRRDLTGETFNFLTGVRYAGYKTGGKAVWWFRCECKRFKRAIGTDVTLGKTISCGCRHSGGHIGSSTYGAIPRLFPQTLSPSSSHARN